LLRVLQQEALVENVAPVQLGIRLLIPEGSRLLELDDIRQSVGPFDAESLVYPWSNPDPRLDALSRKVQAIAASADAAKWPRTQTFEAIWKAAHQAAALPAPELALCATKGVPFLSEPGTAALSPPTTSSFRSAPPRPKNSRPLR